MFIKIPVDRFIGIVLLVCSTTTYIFLPYLIKEPSMNSNQKYGASFFPKVLLILTIALSIVLIIKTFFNKSKENTNESIKKNKKTDQISVVYGKDKKNANSTPGHDDHDSDTMIVIHTLII